jgi:hypothetical protein
VDFDITLGGEGDCGASLSCLLVVFSMEEKYGGLVG